MEKIEKLALILSIQIEVEGMKAANNQSPNSQPYTEKDFIEKANKLKKLYNNSNNISKKLLVTVARYFAGYKLSQKQVEEALVLAKKN